MASNVGTAYIEILPSTDKIVPGIKGALGSESSGPLAREGKRGGGILAGALGAGLKVAGGAVVGVAAAGIGMAFTKGLDRYMKIENAEKKLGALGNSAQDVKRIMDGALASVKGTAFGLGDAADVAASAVASNIKPGKQLDQVLKTVANAAAIAGTDMASMGAIFNKVAASGKAQGDILAQLGDRGVPVVAWLSKELGVASDEVYKLASKGKIDFATFERAMRNGMSPDAAVQMGDTLSGTWDNLGASLGRLGAEVMKKVGPSIKDGMKVAIGAVDGLTGSISGVLNGITSSDLTGKLSELGKVASQSLSILLDDNNDAADEVAWAGPVLDAMVTVRGVAEELGAVFSQALSILLDDNNDAADGVTWAGPVLDAMVTIREAVLGVAEKVQEGFGVIQREAARMWATIEPIVKQVWDWLISKWAEIQPAVERTFTSIMNIVAQVMDVAGTLIGNTMREVGAIMEWVTGRIKEIWDRWGPTFLAVVDGLITGIVGIFEGLFRTAEGIWTALSGMLTGDAEKMKSGLLIIFDGLAVAVRGIFSGLVRILGGIWDGIRTVFAGPVNWVIDNVINPLARAVNTVAEAFGASFRVPLLRATVSGGGGGSGGGAGRAMVPGLATGGRVPGWSPNATADNIPIWATAGEYMIRQSSVKKLQRKHGPLLDYMNKTGHLPPGYEPQGYAGGGRIIPNASQGFRNYDPGFLSAIQAWAAMTGRTWSMTGNGGARSFTDQKRAWNLWQSGRGPLAANPYRGGPHMIPGRAMDLSPRPGEHPASAAMLSRFGLGLTVRGEPWHVGVGNSKILTGGATAGGWDFFGGALDKFKKANVPGGGIWGDILSAIPGKLVELALASTGKIFGFDSGGWLQPGLTLAYNDTNRPEPVLTQKQWRELRAEPAARPQPVNETIQVAIDGRVVAEAVRKHDRSAR